MANSKRRLTVTLPNGTRAQRQTYREYTHVLAVKGGIGNVWTAYSWHGSLYLATRAQDTLDHQRQTWTYQAAPGERNHVSDTRVLPVDGPDVPISGPVGEIVEEAPPYETPTTQADRDCDLEAETDHYDQRDPDWGRPEALRPPSAAMLHPRRSDVRRTQMALFQDGSDLPLFCAGLLLLDDPEVQPPPPADPESEWRS